MNRWNVGILMVQVLILILSVFLFVPKFSKNLVSSNGQDAIALASQMGRLDVISLIFAMFGIILALLAFVGFFSIKAHVKEVAEQEAATVAQNVVEEKIDLLVTSLMKREQATSASDIDTEGGERLTGEENDSSTK